MAKDPLAVFAGEDKPAIEIQPVNDGTPQFKDFYIKDVVCKGAETAIFVRGLPEMNIRNIAMENISIESKEGFVCIEGDNIFLKNATLHCDSKAVVEVQNSKNLVLDKIVCKEGEVFLAVSGQHSKDISVLNTDRTKLKKELELGTGVSNKIVKMK